MQTVTNAAGANTPVLQLSASQKSYQSDPQGFLARLQQRAETLFENGYVVYTTETPHVFIVAGSGKDEKAYAVHAIEQTCDCLFFTRQLAGEYLTDDGSIVVCKHLQGLSLLVRKTRRWLHASGQIEQYCTLWTHWMKTMAAVRRQRIQEAQSQKDRTNEGNSQETPAEVAAWYE